MAMDPMPSHDDAKRVGVGAWSEMKTDADLDVHVPGTVDGADPHIDGPTFGQAPVLFLDDNAADKPDDVLALKSRRRRRPSEPATPPPANFTNTANVYNNTADASVAFSSMELSFVPPHDPVPMGISVGAQFAPPPPSANYVPRLQLPFDNVGAFLQSLTLTFSGNVATIQFLVGSLADLGYDSILALAFVDDRELAMAGIAFPQDQLTIRSCASLEFAARRPTGPPDLYQMVTMSKWLMECGIPRHMATVYMTHLQTYGYDSVQHFDSIGHDNRALSVFRAGHYRLFKYFLERVLQRQAHQPHPPPYASHNYGNVYYNTNTSAARPAADDFNSTLLDDLVPSTFPLSPSVQPTTSMYQQNAYYNAQAAPSNPPPPPTAASFTDMMHDGATTTAGPPVRPLTEPELRLLYEAVNSDDKTNPCRRGKKIDWQVIATNGMGDPKYTVLAQYTADELEQNYVRNHELPLHTTARNSEWSPDLIKLLWKVSQDTRCKNGNKTMWEQIANGRTGVTEYQPLAKFSNSQLRSRFRTEFGDKRPQSRKKARETKNALARAAALGLGDKSAVQLKNAAKSKTTAAKARKDIHDENRQGLNGPSSNNNPPSDPAGSMAV